MFIPVVFRRQLGGGADQNGVVYPALGSDLSPLTNYPTKGVRPVVSQVTTKLPTQGQDNIVVFPQYDKSGDPVTALQISYAGPATAATQTAHVYMWDENTQQWYELANSPVTLTLNTISIITVPTISNRLPSKNAMPQAASPAGSTVIGQADGGDMALMVGILAAGGAIAGTYAFGMWPSTNSK